MWKMVCGVGVGVHAICLIPIVFRPKNRRFQALEGRFLPQRRPCKEVLAPEVHKNYSVLLRVAPLSQTAIATKATYLWKI